MDHEAKLTQEDISGTMSVQMANGQTLDDFCAQHIPEYNRERFEALAIRVFVGDETVITVFAIDKPRQEGGSQEKLPVKKFKITTLPLSALFSYCHSFNCTLSTRDYPLEDMEVINK